jgi:hypothetical protein
MLRLGRVAMLLVVGALFQSAAAAQPDHVTYVLGGIMSGPFRLDGDLVTGQFSQADAPPGKLGDGAGLDARTMPVTRHWTVSPDKLDALRRLAERVWRHGMTKEAARARRGADGLWVVPPIVCQPTLDALGELTLEQGERKRDFDFSMTCLSKDGDRFLKALFAAK